MGNNQGSSLMRLISFMKQSDCIQHVWKINAIKHKRKKLSLMLQVLSNLPQLHGKDAYFLDIVGTEKIPKNIHHRMNETNKHMQYQWWYCRDKPLTITTLEVRSGHLTNMWKTYKMFSWLLVSYHSHFCCVLYFWCYRG